MTGWSMQRIADFAPDVKSMAAARTLARPGPWSETGHTDSLLWGKCQGSGASSYQVTVDLAAGSVKCTCPSRKFPCKHGLALLMLHVDRDSVDAIGGSTMGAAEWAHVQASRRSAAATRPSTNVDPEAQARRLAERIELMSAGIDEFENWLLDLVRQGLASARHRDASFWDAAAARLVDSQMPALGERVREGIALAHSGPQWADRLLDEITLWWLSCQAWKRRDLLDAPDVANLRTMLGWATRRADVLSNDTESGRWTVLGAHRTLDGRLDAQRTWLRHHDSGEVVVVLDFAGAGSSLPAPQLAGAVLDTTLGLYPGSRPRRATFGEQPLVVAQSADLGPAVDLDTARRTYAAAVASNAWLVRVSVTLDRITFDVTDTPAVIDIDGASIAIDGDAPWELLACSGGEPVTVFGELERSIFRPLSAVVDQRVLVL